MYISLDCETTGLNLRRDCNPFMVVASDEAGKVRCWEWPVDPKTRRVDVNGIDVIEIHEYLAGNEIIFHHAQYDLRALANIGLLLKTPEWEVPNPLPPSKLAVTVKVKAIHDTLFASHLVDSRGVYKSNGRSSHGLKELSISRLHVSDADEIAIRKAVQRARTIAKNLGWDIGPGVGDDYWLPKALWNFRELLEEDFQNPNDVIPDIPEEWKTIARKYALTDVRDRTMMLFLTCREILQRDGRWDMYLEELRLVPIFYMIEERGMRIEEKRINTQRKKHRNESEVRLRSLRDLAGNHDLNLNSPIQLRKLLFEKWKLKSTGRTKKANLPSTDAKALEGLRDYLAFHPEINDRESGLAYEFLCLLIGDKNYETDEITPGYRQHLKSLGYLDSYAALMIDDRVHPTVHPTGTGTTRISQSDPNGQNVGKKKIDGVSLRYVFGPPPGHIWLSVDYEQLELRIFAALANDESMIESFEQGYDFHSFVASRIFNLPPEKISSEQRRIAKNTNFAIIFGGSPSRVDSTAGMHGAYDAFAKQFPSAKKFMDKTIAEVRSNGFIKTADGYPLYAPASEPFKAVDYRVQGTAGRVIKLAMKWLFYGRSLTISRFKDTSPVIDNETVSFVTQIHDELVFELATQNKTRKDTVRLIREIMAVMEQAGELIGITTPVSCKVHVENWSDGISLRQYTKGTVCKRIAR